MEEQNKEITIIPPGKVIKEKLDKYPMSQKEFALRMDLSEKHVSKLINGEVPLSIDVAFRLANILDEQPSFWINLEKAYQEQLYKNKLEKELENESRLASIFPYEELASLNLVPNSNRIDKKVANLKKFFGVNRLSLLLENQQLNPLNKKIKEDSKEDIDLLTLTRIASIEADKVEVAKIDVRKLGRQINKIKPLTFKRPNSFVPILTSILSKCGVALINLPRLENDGFHNFCFKDNNRIVLGITLSRMTSDDYWLPLFAELGHIILNNLGKESNEEMAQEETRFAMNVVMEETLYKSLVNEPELNLRTILNYSIKANIDISLVVGLLEKDGYINKDSELDKTKNIYYQLSHYEELNCYVNKRIIS